MRFFFILDHTDKFLYMCRFGGDAVDVHTHIHTARQCCDVRQQLHDLCYGAIHRQADNHEKAKRGKRRKSDWDTKATLLGSETKQKTRAEDTFLCVY